MDMVTDRTRADVDLLKLIISKSPAQRTAAEQQLLLDPNNKGAYNYTDFNRLNKASKEIQDRMIAVGFSEAYANKNIPNTPWKAGDIPNREQLNILAENIERALSIVNGAPLIYDWGTYNIFFRALDYEVANEIEKALIRADEELKKYEGV